MIQVAHFYQVKSCLVCVCGDLLTHCPVISDVGDINVAVRCETTQIQKIKKRSQWSHHIFDIDIRLT